MKTIEEVDRFFIENKIQVCILGNSAQSGWYLTAEKHADGMSLKLTQRGECLLVVAEKFEQFVRKGAPNLLAPQLEHVSRGVPDTLDDIPY